jgi:hypothetical protein
MRAGLVKRLLGVLVCCVLLLLTVDSCTAPFADSDNPISEGGMWTNGAVNGLDWANVRTTAGLAFGAQPEFGPRYADSTALLTGTWGPAQMVEATVHTVDQKSGIIEEVEIRLRSAISPHSNTGYEVSSDA